MEVLSVKLNNRGAAMYPEYKECTFHIPKTDYYKRHNSLSCYGFDASKDFLKVVFEFTIPDDVELKIKTFQKLSTQYPHNDMKVFCQCTFLEPMKILSGKTITLNRLTRNSWFYMNFAISLDMLEIDGFKDKIKRVN